MDNEQLVTAVRKRAEDRSKRTDNVDRDCPELGPLASPEVVLAAERAMGCALNPLHRQLFAEVANGGFGPGFGLVGLPGGTLDGEGRSLVDLREILWLDAYTPLPHPVVPLCEWGCGIWSCLDGETGAVLTMDEYGLKDIGQMFPAWLEDWVSGVSLMSRMIVHEERTIINPFTKQPMKAKLSVGTVGTPYIPRQRMN
ncbi:MAG: SMI1/KNR4 family protein [Byssovorax sp.]